MHELESVRRDLTYADRLPSLLRVALAIDDPLLSRRLTAGVEPVTPQRANALASARAQLAEPAGDQLEAAALYAHVAARWQTFGNVPERAYPLLGHGRCLLALRDTGAEAPLSEARRLFASMGYNPALAETEGLLGDAVATAS